MWALIVNDVFFLHVVPSPIFVMVSSNILNLIQPIGSSVTLICTVYLSPAVDIPVTVNTVWTGPAGFMMTNVATLVINATTYISVSLIDYFERDRFGNYTCAATVSSKSVKSFLSDSNMQSGSTRVAFGEMMIRLTQLDNLPLLTDFPCHTDQYLMSEVSCTCFRETGMVVGILTLIEGIMIIAITMLLVCRFMWRYYI